MESVVACIQALSSSQGDLTQLTAQLKSQTAQLTAHAAAIPDAVQTLDASAHSLGLTFLLDAWCRVGVNQNGDTIFINSTARLLHGCLVSAPQISTIPDIFSRVCRAFKEQVLAIGCPRMGILPLISGIRALQESPDMLTPMHADCFQLCLLSKCYNAASQLLEEDIFNVDPSRTACVPQDLLLYSYYGGMLCTGRKNYSRALELFMLGLTAPSMVKSAIVLAIYKKHVLVSLIHLGHLPALPKFTPQSVKSMADSDARMYLELAQAYATHSSQKLNRCMEVHAQQFNADGNMGLVQLVVSSLATRSIQRLTQTYLTLSLADIASRVGLASPEQAEVHLIGMLQTGAIHASISEQDGGMVRFLEDTDDIASNLANKAGLTRRLESHIRSCMQISDRVQRMHDSVSTDREYLKKVGQRDKSSRLGDLGDFEGLGGFAPGLGMFQP